MGHGHLFLVGVLVAAIFAAWYDDRVQERHAPNAPNAPIEVPAGFVVGP